MNVEPSALALFWAAAALLALKMTSLAVASSLAPPGIQGYAMR